MFTPQRKLSGWSLTPHKNTSSGGGDGGLDRVSKGKGVAFLEGPAPPLALLGENGGGGGGGGEGREGDAEVWRKFREAGLLDEASLEKKGREALLEKISALTDELNGYQYHMGLLLIEKKEWTSKYEELQQSLTEMKEILKREQTAHLIAISEINKREENLKKALGVEKQCVTDLEKALREIRSECAETKYSSDQKMAEAHALMASNEHKSLEVEAKLHAADAKLAEANRKNSEMERKLKELEARENLIRSERQSFMAERAMLETTQAKQREDLQDWERTLQEREDRLAEGRRILSQREEKANETDLFLKQKERDLEDAQKKIEMTNSTLKKKEEVDVMKKKLQIQETELIELEQKLNAREKEEIQKCLDEHNASLNLKMAEFEVEMEHKRKALDEELKSKVVALEDKETEIHHQEEKLSKREQALEKRMEKSKEKEKDLELKWKAYKEREKSIKAEEKKLEMERKQILTDKDNMQILITEIEKKKAENEEQQRLLHEERENLRVIEEERNEILHLQSELKKEKDSWKYQEELLLKEREELKQDRENFEREWEVLDEKKADNAKELKCVTEEKENFKKWKQSEEEKLKAMKMDTEIYVQREMEDLRRQKESFEALMEHEQSAMAEKTKIEHENMIYDFEQKKRAFEVEMEHKREEMKKQQEERERAFEEQKERDLNNINYLREIAGREMEDMKLERQRIEKEKRKADADKEHLAKQEHDLKNDIDKLDKLIEKLKNQREQFKQLIENNMSCKHCGSVIGDSILFDLQSLQEMEDSQVLPSSSMRGNKAPEQPVSNLSPVRRDSSSPASGAQMSWLRKCTSKILNLSPLKRAVDIEGQGILQPEVPCSQADDLSQGLGGSEDLQELSLVHGDRVLSFNSAREVVDEPTQSFGEPSIVDSKAQELPEESLHSDMKNDQGKSRRRRNPGVRRTRSVKAVVDDAKAILGESEEQDGRQENGDAEQSAHVNEESRGDSSLANKEASTTGRKRHYAHASRSTASEQDDENDARSDSVTAGGRRKRRQTVAPGSETPGEQRYNLRRPKTGSRAAGARAPSNVVKGKEKETKAKKAAGKETDKPTTTVSSHGVVSEDGESAHPMQANNLNAVVEVREISSERVVRLETTMENADDNGDATKLTETMELSDEVNGTPGATGGDSDEEYGSEGGEDDDEDDENEHPGEASIGKKLKQVRDEGALKDPSKMMEQSRSMFQNELCSILILCVDEAVGEVVKAVLAVGKVVSGTGSGRKYVGVGHVCNGN
ncbi:hypothetical protein Sjap_026296 [Stephania japonica]|uniref:Nuclear matrix constituent protein 1-like protein n=1 Tax=Stephania japonica TaxID=461633 RepID=A0AAP0E393_9MAGN